MKNIIKYLGALLAVVLIGTAFTSCKDADEPLFSNVGLGIKTFFPTKVVTNQPMTINGSGFFSATEIEFPGGVKVTDFEVVSDDMIRVNAPAGIPEEGGKIIVRTADEEAESRLPLTVGHTLVSGFSKQPGEKATGGELITVYGTDLEFIDYVELLDADSAWQVVDQKDFYRKGTSNLIFYVPRKAIYTGTFVGYLHTYDGQRIALPELSYEPGADGGHSEIVKETIWKNDGSLGENSWGGEYRFAPESNPTGEECYIVPQDIWERMKTETFYVTVKGATPQIRVTSGWWSTTWTGNDIQPGNELLEDLGDGTYRLTVNLAGDPLVDVIDAEHLLFTGGGYSVEEIYFIDIVPGSTPKEVVLWTNDGSKGSISWGGDYRFSSEEKSTGEEIYAFPADAWEIIKGGTFYLTASMDADWYNLRITTGWWSTTWTGADIGKGDERLIDNGDGTFTLEINFSGDAIQDVLDAEHLLFTGEGYTPLKLYYVE